MQGYALKRVIESKGHKVSFSDFRSGEPRHIGEKIKTATFFERISKIPAFFRNPFQYLEKRAFRTNFKNTFEVTAWKILNIDSQMDYDYACDLMIIGSDEVFNYTQNHVFGYVPAFFGHGINAKSIVSYAASAGYATPKDVENDNMQKELTEGFAKFDYIGVRDKNTYELVSRYSSAQPKYVIDPTLLYDFNTEVPGQSIPSGYLLVYAYDGRLDAPDDVEKIRAFANAKGLRIVSVGFYHEWCDENLVLSPFEVLSVFKHASYIVTDTFHGTIFSIKNQKPFVSLLRKENRWGSNSNKLGFLLSQLGLESRINRNLDNLASHLDDPIDYVRVNERISQLRESSIQFLDQALKSAELKLKREK
jgi:hypothetical protein